MTRKLAETPDTGPNPDKNYSEGEKRPKAEPRMSLAPLDFEEALENLLAVKPDDGEDDQTRSES